MFTPYNPNPRGINTGDCVIRAICKAMDKTLEKVYAELTIKGLQEAMWGTRIQSAQSAYLLSQLGKFVINAPATAG